MHLRVTALLLALVLIGGGAGQSYPLIQILLQVAALATAAYLVLTPRTWRVDHLTMVALLISALTLLLPLLQLVPLPPDLWRQLPGREIPSRLDDVVAASRWRPLSLDVEGTVRAVLSLLPAAVLFLAASRLPIRDRVRLMWVILVVAIAGAALGILQFATGGRFTPFDSAHSGFATGFFVNRNHSAGLSLVGMPLAAAFGVVQMARGRPRLPCILAAVSALLVFALSILATTSRMGLLLLPLATAAALLIIFYRRQPWRIALPAVAAVCGLGLFLSASGGFDRTLDRFSGMSDSRFSYWTDIRWALDEYGLAGTGFGTFPRVYQSAESLAAVVPSITNHAHNDYLEIALEGGLPALALLMVFFAVLANALVRAARVRKSGTADVAAIAAAAGVAILLLGSIVDYPLRMPALSGAFAVLCSTVLGSGRSLRGETRELSIPSSRSAPHTAANASARAAALVVGAALVLVVIQAGMSSRDLARQSHRSAVGWASWSTRGHERLATDLMLAGRASQSLRHARAAADLSPISAPAIRTLALLDLTQGRGAAGMRLMELALRLGWRDVLTQMWAIGAAESAGDPKIAAERAEALFRQQRSILPAMVQILRSRHWDEIASALALRLGQEPHWRRAFFETTAKLPLEESDRLGLLLQKLSGTSAPARREEIQPLISALVDSGRSSAAQHLWNSARGGELVLNGDFMQVEKDSAGHPKFWNVPEPLQSRVSVAPAAGAADGLALKAAEVDGPSPVLSQPLMLRPGTYALTYRAMSRGRSVHLQWELKCEHPSQRQVQNSSIAAGGAWQTIRWEFVVPEQDCPVQTLVLNVLQNTPILELWLDQIVLAEPVR